MWPDAPMFRGLTSGIIQFLSPVEHLASRPQRQPATDSERGEQHDRGRQRDDAERRTEQAARAAREEDRDGAADGHRDDGRRQDDEREPEANKTELVPQRGLVARLAHRARVVESLLRHAADRYGRGARAAACHGGTGQGLESPIPASG